MEKLSLQENQKIAVGILDAVSKVCDEQGYRYYLVFGTLIGAVRHKGFIPWDDDLDIMMPRPDHDRFVEYFVNHREEFPNLKIFTPDLNKEYPYMIPGCQMTDIVSLWKMKNHMEWVPS